MTDQLTAPAPTSEPATTAEEIAGSTPPGRNSHSWLNPGWSPRRRWPFYAVLVFLPLALLYLYYKLHFPGLLNPDALDFAQLGRNLLDGKGFVTHILRPLALIHGDHPFRQPDLTHGPLFPLALAFSFSILGVHDGAAAATSGVFYLLTVPVVYLLGQSAFNRTVGFIAAVLYAANPLMLMHGTSGLHVTLCLFLATCLFYTLYVVTTAPVEIAPQTSRKDRQKYLRYARLRATLVGLFAAGLYLTEPLFAPLLPLVWIYTVRVHPEARRQRALWTGGAILLVVLPWMLRNWQFGANPVFGLRQLEVAMASTYSMAEAWRLPAGTVQLKPALLGEILTKWFGRTYQILLALPSLAGIWLLAAILPGLLYPPKPAARRVRNVILGSLLLLLGASLVYHLDLPLFLTFLPALIVFAVADLQGFAWDSSLPTRTVGKLAAVLGVVLLFSTVGAFVLARKPTVAGEIAVIRSLGRLAGEQDVVLSDQPWLVAWYARRPALWIPAKEEGLIQARQRFPHLRWALLTPYSRTLSKEWETVYNASRQWNEAYQSPVAPGKQRIGPMVVNGRSGRPWFKALEGLTPLPVKDEKQVPAMVLGVFANVPVPPNPAKN